MAWTYLIIAGLLEVAWAYLMKRSEGFTRPVFTAGTLVLMTASFALLAAAMRTLPLGVSYMVWTGIGAVGAFVVGAFVLGEPLTPLRLLGAGLLVCGLVVMKLSATA